MREPLVSLEQAKAHLRVVSNFEDADIQLKLSAAIEIAVAYLDRQVFATQAEMAAALAAGEAGPMPMVCTDMVRAGILLILGDLYANREDVVAGSAASRLPTGARACLNPKRRKGC